MADDAMELDIIIEHSDMKEQTTMEACLILILDQRLCSYIHIRCGTGLSLSHLIVIMF